MEIAFVTKYDTLEINNWSDTEYFMSKSLEDSGCTLDYISKLEDQFTLFARLKAKYYNLKEL